MRIIYDLETYPNVFTFSGLDANSDDYWQFEVSNFRSQADELMQFLLHLELTESEMVGFNNVGFDYPILHQFMLMNGKCGPNIPYEKCCEIIGSQDNGEKFSHIVYPKNRRIKQIDLFRIHHFDNRAKTTSLKAIEFNLKMDSVEELPFRPGTVLNQAQIVELLRYNLHDTVATKLFYRASEGAIRFREELSKKMGQDFMNHNDVKIGKDIFQKKLESAGIQCYVYGDKGRQPKQTPRPRIFLRDCIPHWIRFINPEFQGIMRQMAAKSITETKGALDDMSCSAYGVEFVFGTGGLHASVINKACVADDEFEIRDADVTSMYPSIAIVNGYYPEHLGEYFVKIYTDLKAERLKFKKGTPENNALKLALNGTFGASNDKFSVFFDPLFTMKITIGGQLMLAMLADSLGQVEGLKIIQCNTDGITCKIPRDKREEYDDRCRDWEKLTKLELEFADFQKIFIADVNNYVAQDLTGKVKRKGRYDYSPQWHQNASRLVVPKVAEQFLIYDKPLTKTVKQWPDKYDFMARVKVPRTSRLQLEEIGGNRWELPNITRYYVAKGGGKLIKIMPPLPKNPTQWREIGVEAKLLVCPCNDIRDSILPIDFDYYVREVEKLTNGFGDI
jgi:hypothetical protein